MLFQLKWLHLQLKLSMLKVVLHITAEMVDVMLAIFDPTKVICWAS